MVIFENKLAGGDEAVEGTYRNYNLICIHLKNHIKRSAHTLPDSERDKWGRLRSTRGGGCKCLISDLGG